MPMTYIQYITQFSRKKDNVLVYQLHSNNIYQLYNSITFKGVLIRYFVCVFSWVVLMWAFGQPTIQNLLT